MNLQEKYKTTLKKYGVSTPIRIAHFMAQIEHESGLKPINENLNYSAKRLLEIFSKYFDSETAKQYAMHPQSIANRVYANRMGNGPEPSGDGYRFRGRGYIQLTGKENYSKLSTFTGTDYVNNPDLLLNEADALISALWFWQKNGLNELADKDDIKTITKRINGGLNGIEHRKILLKKYKSGL